MNDTSNLQPLAPAQAQPVAPASVAAPQQPQQQGGVSYGGPEVAPQSASSAEQKNSSTEFGYDQIKRIESAAEAAERSIERKDNQRIQAKQQPPKKEEKLAQKEKEPEGPKFFGYMVSPSLANNYSLIASSKGKGDTESTKTWIFMLLDRLLKKQSLS